MNLIDRLVPKEPSLSDLFKGTIRMPGGTIDMFEEDINSPSLRRRVNGYTEDSDGIYISNTPPTSENNLWIDAGQISTLSFDAISSTPSYPTVERVQELIREAITEAFENMNRRNH